MSRSVGIKRDLRLNKLETYSNYYYLNFRSYLGQHGDCYDRFLIRMNEMAESQNIINQVVNKMNKFKFFNDFNNNFNNKSNSNLTKSISHNLLKFINKHYLNFSNSKNNYSSMENLINHFKY
jgi:NADH:ubiquinone oxidoreductase subunit D